VEHAGTTVFLACQQTEIPGGPGKEGGREGEATYSAQVHGMFNDVEVIGETEFGRIHRLLEDPPVLRLELLQDEGEELREEGGKGGREDTGVRMGKKNTRNGERPMSGSPNAPTAGREDRTINGWIEGGKEGGKEG